MYYSLSKVNTMNTKMNTEMIEILKEYIIEKSPIVLLKSL